jgi:hypothetical protein
MLLLLLQLLLL